MVSLKSGLGLLPAPSPSLAPLLWHDVNLLYIPGERLSDVLRELCRSLPLEVRAPRNAYAREVSEEEWRDSTGGGSLSLDESVAHQISMSGELAALAYAMDARFADAALWCEHLDTNGWLNVSTSEAARTFGGGEKAFLEALGVVQRAVEPAGLFARDAAECLLLQLEATDEHNSDAKRLLTEGRAALESGREALDSFRAELGWTPERLKRAMDALRRLDPTPGRFFSIAPPVRPELDFFLSEDNSHQNGGGVGIGTLRCRLARENLPHLSLISEDLQATLKRKEWGRAKLLLLRLGLRYRTLLRIGLLLAERQTAYLSANEKRPSELLPLGLKDVAAGTGLHVATVSRCLANTWARSPAGTLRLSSLLSRSLRGLPYAVLERTLREAAETGESDAAISKRTGIPRRTIAYHRKRLGIVSSRAKPAR